jgi:hypothetical protein
MPYLDPSTVLERFSRFAITAVRPVLPDDEEFVAGQVGSMASTLQFLSGELATSEDAVDRQERALDAAIPDVEAVIDERDLTAPTLRGALTDARSAVESGGDVRAREGTVLEATDELLAAIESELAGEDARAARRPLYGVLDVRLDAQHAMLGRDTGEDGDE